MNRRELLGNLTAAMAGAGIAGTVDVIEAEPKPLLLVLRPPRLVSNAAMTAVRLNANVFRHEHPELPPIVVLEYGMTLDAILDPRFAGPDLRSVEDM